MLLQRNKAESRAAAAAELQHRLKAELLEGKAGLSFSRSKASPATSSIHTPTAAAGWLADWLTEYRLALKTRLFISPTISQHHLDLTNDFL